MPCLNEERTVGLCIQKVQRAFLALGVVGEVIVADNGSSDRSVEIASTLGARVVESPRKGYGAALMTGIAAARGDVIIMADSDDSYDWLDIAPFLDAVRSGADLVIGNRFAGGIEPGAMPRLHRYLGNPVLSWLARSVHAAPIADFHCGMRAFRRTAIQQMDLRAPGMEFATEMIVNAVRSGFTIKEVPITLHRDGRDRPPHLRPFRDGWRHLRFILAYGPNHLFITPGGVSLALGLVMLTALAGGPIIVAGQYFGIHFLALACALTLVGFNIIHYGILAKVAIVRRVPGSRSRVAQWIMSRYSLEVALVAGTLLGLGGVGADVWLLLRWLSSGGASMESTVHAVFVATLAIVIGVNLCMGAFLLHILVAEARD